MKLLVYELRMILANSAINLAMTLAPKSKGGLRLIIAIGKHYENEIRLPEVFR